MKYIKHPGLEMRDSENHGKGIFTNQFIKKGTVLEECHCIPIHRGQRVKRLDPYLYEMGTKTNGPTYAIVLGFGSTYNSSKEKENITFTVDTKNRLYTFTALRDIEPEEELFFYYGKF